MNWNYINYVIKNEGVYSLLNRKYKKIKTQISNHIFFTENDIIKWKNLKDKYEGKRVFLIGNGPSLNKTPLYLLKGEYCMCFNRFSIMAERLNWLPEFFTCTDDLLLYDFAKEFNKILDGCNFCFIPKIHNTGKLIFKIINSHEKLYWLKYEFGMNFSTNLPIVFPGGTCIYEGMQILHYLGFSEIYLLGIDMNYRTHTSTTRLNSYSTDIISNKDDDPNHFDPRYFGKGRSYHQPEKYIIDNMMDSLTFIAERQNVYGTNIINCGIDSKVECFPRKELMDVLGYDNDEIEKCFDSLIANKSSYQNHIEFERYNRQLKREEDIDSIMSSDFYTDLDIALSIIKRLVFTHLPLGPFENKYYFIHLKNNNEE